MGNYFFKDRFKDKVMLITGAASGTGRATALRAAQEGAKLILVDIKKAKGEEILKDVKDLGGEAIFLNYDISCEENVKKMIDKTIEAFGALHIAVNNAGVIGNPVPIHEITRENLDFAMNNNFYTVFFCCKYEIQQFMSQGKGGVIVNNASIAGLIGFPESPAYVSSKHAVNGLTKNLALDYGKFGIRVNSVNPVRNSASMVDAAILFLASDDACRMTGTALQTDGGWTAF